MVLSETVLVKGHVAILRAIQKSGSATDVEIEVRTGLTVDSQDSDLEKWEEELRAERWIKRSRHGFWHLTARGRNLISGL